MITIEEQARLTHWTLWGSDGYPVCQLGRGWTVELYPVVFKTKREAVAAWEAHIDLLIAKKGGRL